MTPRNRRRFATRSRGPQGEAQPKRETSPWALNIPQLGDGARPSSRRGGRGRAPCSPTPAGWRFPVEHSGRGGKASHQTYLHARKRPLRRQFGVHRLDDRDARPDAVEARHRGAEGALRPEAAVRRVPFCQLFSEPGAGSDLAAWRPGGARRRRVRGHRPEGVELGRAVLRLGDAPVRTDPDAPKHRASRSCSSTCRARGSRSARSCR